MHTRCHYCELENMAVRSNTPGCRVPRACSPLAGSMGNAPSMVQEAEPLVVVLPIISGDITVVSKSVMSYNHVSNHLFWCQKCM